MDLLTQIIQLNEGYCSTIYKCPAGRETFGYGTSLNEERKKEVEACRQGELEALATSYFQDDVTALLVKLRAFSWFTELSELRRVVIVDLAYQMGIHGLLGFSKMIAALKEQNFGHAHDELLDSLYHAQLIKYAYKDECPGICEMHKGALILWFNNFLNIDEKQLRSTANAQTLMFDKPLGKYKDLNLV